MKNSGDITLLSNDELFTHCKKEEESIFFGELYRRYIPLIYGLCLKYLGNVDDAQDAVMDLFEEISQKIKLYDIKNFHSWLYSVTKNHCLLRLRQSQRSFFVNIDEIVMENGDFFTLLDKEKSSDEESALMVCMNQLCEEQRKCVEYFYYENKSYADIVSITGYTPDKVKSYIQNGKRNLKNCIMKMLHIE